MIGRFSDPYVNSSLHPWKSVDSFNTPSGKALSNVWTHTKIHTIVGNLRIKSGPPPNFRVLPFLCGATGWVAVNIVFQLLHQLPNITMSFVSARYHLPSHPNDSMIPSPFMPYDSMSPSPPSCPHDSIIMLPSKVHSWFSGIRLSSEPKILQHHIETIEGEY